MRMLLLSINVLTFEKLKWVHNYFVQKYRDRSSRLYCACRQATTKKKGAIHPNARYYREQ